MLIYEKMQKLYEGIIAGKELTTKELNSYGFNSKDLTDLVENGVLKRIKRGYYTFILIDDLFYYGKNLINEKEYEKATKCFEKCYELDPSHLGSCFQLFLRSIQKQDYKMTFEYLDVLFTTENPYYNADNNFYLYLLNIITEVPKKNQDYAKCLKFEDVKIDSQDKRYQNIPAQNKLRAIVFQKKLAFALTQFKFLKNENNYLNIQNTIIRTLLEQAIKVETIGKNKLLEFTKSKEYNEIINFLENKAKRQNLSLTETYILKLAYEILNVRENQDIPLKKVFEAKSLFEAIDGFNYELALELNKSYNEKYNINSSENIINLLLLDLCELINKLSSLPEYEDENIFEFDELPPIESILENEPPTFETVIKYLMKTDLDNAFLALKSYLSAINKNEYEFLIVDLIKVSLSENDMAFTKPIITLNLISKELFKFEIATYIEEFYVALAKNNFSKARIYLDIVSQANKLGQECVLGDILLQALNNTEKIIEAKKESAEKKVSYSSPTSPISKQISEPKATIVEAEAKEITAIEPPAIKSERSFLENKYNLLLQNRGAILLKPMDFDRIKRIMNMAKEYPDMNAFYVGNTKERQVILRYKPVRAEFVDVKNLRDKGLAAYKAKKYDECIEYYLQVSQIGKPNPYSYAYLGLSYMHKRNKAAAINYLTIATKLSLQENGKLDFSELIAKLSGITDTKPHVKMKIEEFESDSNNNYGINNFDEITAYIMESGLDVESACHELEIPDEQIDIIRLVYAKEFYSQGNFEKGDQFLKVVEQSQNKTKLTIKLLDEIRKNKKFYMNRPGENPKQLVFSLLPKAKKAPKA